MYLILFYVFICLICICAFLIYILKLKETVFFIVPLGYTVTSILFYYLDDESTVLFYEVYRKNVEHIVLECIRIIKDDVYRSLVTISYISCTGLCPFPLIFFFSETPPSPSPPATAGPPPPETSHCTTTQCFICPMATWIFGASQIMSGFRRCTIV